MNILKSIRHKHQFYSVGALEHLQLESSNHTTVVIMKCRWCPEFYSFPSDNLELALKEGTLETKKVLQNYNNRSKT